MKKNTLTILIISAISIVLLFGIQSPDMSSGLSSTLAQILKVTLHNFPGGSRPVQEIEEQIRKIAHFGEYLILTTVVYMTISYHVHNKILRIIVTVIAVGLISFVDEAFIQRLFSGGRGVSIYDIVYDMLGSMASILNIIIIDFYQSRKNY